MSLPANQHKLEVVDTLADVAEEAGLSLLEMAIAFVLVHPTVTSPIIGPRTMEHLESQLKSVEVKLDAATLDKIDEIVLPGTNLNAADGGYQPPSIVEPRLRRRA